MTWAGITNPFLTPLFLGLPLEARVLTVIVPSGFSVTIAGVLLESVSLWTAIVAGGTRETHPDKSARTGKS
jgi:hypothetical protein